MCYLVGAVNLLKGKSMKAEERLLNFADGVWGTFLMAFFSFDQLHKSGSRGTRNAANIRPGIERR